MCYTTFQERYNSSLPFLLVLLFHMFFCFCFVSGCQLTDLYTYSKWYVSLDCLVDLDVKLDVNYVNVHETREKKMERKGQVSCISSDVSAVNYSMVVFTKT